LDEENYKAKFLSYFANVIFYAASRYFQTTNKIKYNEIELDEDIVVSLSDSERDFEEVYESFGQKEKATGCNLCTFSVGLSSTTKIVL